MSSVESRVGKMQYAKQAAKGTAASTAFRLGRWAGGDAEVNREDGSENYIDANRFNSSQDFVDTIVGNGNPILQGQAGVTGSLAYLFLGQESVDSPPANSPITHTSTPAASAFWSTWWKSVGATVVSKKKFYDCRMTSLRLEASAASKVLKVTPTWFALGQETYVTDPTGVEEVGEPLVYTEAVGTFKIDGAVFKGHSSFAVQLNDNVTPWYGDDVTPHDVIFGLGNIVVEGITILVDQAGLERYNQQIYGVINPPAGTAPLKGIPALGSYEFTMQRGSVYQHSKTSGTGSFTYTVSGQTTTSLPDSSTAAQVQAALEALSTVGSGQVSVTGGPISGTPYVITFRRAGVVVTKTDTTIVTALTSLGVSRQVKVLLPSVKWSPDLAIPASPDGGPVELSMSAEARNDGVNPMISIITKSADLGYAGIM